METAIRPSMISATAGPRWLSPSLALALHGAVAAALLTVTLEPPPPDVQPVLMVEMVTLAAPEPAPEPAAAPSPPATPKPSPPAAPVPAPAVTAAPRIVPKAAAPLKLAPKPAAVPTPPAPASPAVPDAAAAAPASGPDTATPPFAPAGEPAPESYVPPSGHAAYLSNPRPPYPSLARKRGWEGTVVLAVMVDADGRPLEVTVKTSSGHSVLDHCALNAVRQWRFTPARRGGRTVAAGVEVPIRFDLRDSATG